MTCYQAACVREFAVDQHGATMLEYALLAALLSLSAIAGISTSGKAAAGTFEQVGVKIASGTGVPVPLSFP